MGNHEGSDKGQPLLFLKVAFYDDLSPACTGQSDWRYRIPAQSLYEQSFAPLGFQASCQGSFGCCHYGNGVLTTPLRNCTAGKSPETT